MFVDPTFRLIHKRWMKTVVYVCLCCKIELSRLVAVTIPSGLELVYMQIDHLRLKLHCETDGGYISLKARAYSTLPFRAMIAMSTIA